MVELLTLREAAAQLRIGPKTLRDHVRAGKGPPSLLVSNRLRFPSAQLTSWISRKVTTETPKHVRLTAETSVTVSGKPVTAYAGPSSWTDARHS
jgi:hypothetical protein